MKLDAFVELRNRLLAKDRNFIVIRKTPATLNALGPSNDGKVWFWDELNGRAALVYTVESALDLASNLTKYEKRAEQFLHKLCNQVVRPLSFGIKQTKEEWFDKVFREAATKICKEIRNDRAFFVTMVPGDYVCWEVVDDLSKEVDVQFYSRLSPDIENRFSRKTRNQTSGIIHMLMDLTFPDNTNIMFFFGKYEREDGSIFLEVKGGYKKESGITIQFNDATRI